MISNNKQIKILHIHVLPVITGSGINTFLTMNGLKDKYHIEMACAPGGPLNELVMKHGIAVHPIKNFVSEVSLFKDLHALWQVYRLLRREKYDLIHTHNSKGSFIGRLAAKLAGGPPVIYTAHGYSFHENENWMRRTTFFTLEKMAKNWSARVICISQPLVDLWVKKKLAQPHKIRKIYSGIDIKEYTKDYDRAGVRQGMGLRPNDIVIGQVSKLWEGKGHEDIIAAAPRIFHAVNNARIVFVGDGPIREKLESLVLKNNLHNRIIFTGHRDDVAAVTAALDIAVLASHYEGMGRVVLEAMAAGLPVVAARVGGITDLVVQNQTGILVDPHSPEQLAEAIIRLAKDPQMRENMGLCGQTRVDSTFSVHTMIKKIDSVYEEVLSEHDRDRKNK